MVENDLLRLYPGPGETGVYGARLGSNVNVTFRNCVVDGRRIPDTELRMRSDGKTSTWNVSSASSVRVSAKVERRSTTQEDEREAAMSVRDFLNRTEGSDYEVEMPRERGSHGEKAGQELYIDAYLRGTRPAPDLLPLQVRHFHDDLTKRLKKGSLSRYQLNKLPELAQAAIDAKGGVELAERQRTALVLYSPVPLDSKSIARITGAQYELRGFRAVYLGLFWDEAIQLSGRESRSGGRE